MLLIKDFLRESKLLIFLLVISISITVSYGITLNMPVIINVDYQVVNFFYGKLVDLSIGYVVSLLFYVLVVYYPEHTKKRKLRSRTIIIFGRLQTYIKTYMDMCVEVVDIRLGKYSVNSYEAWKKYFENNRVDIFYCLGRELEDKTYRLYLEGNTYLEVMEACAKNIEHYKRELIPLIMYLSDKELELYSTLEKILIFEQINKGLEAMAVDALFITDFEYILKSYDQVGQILGVRR